MKLPITLVGTFARLSQQWRPAFAEACLCHCALFCVLHLVPFGLAGALSTSVCLNQHVKAASCMLLLSHTTLVTYTLHSKPRKQTMPARECFD